MHEVLAAAFPYLFAVSLCIAEVATEVWRGALTRITAFVIVVANIAVLWMIAIPAAGLGESYVDYGILAGTVITTVFSILWSILILRVPSVEEDITETEEKPGYSHYVPANPKSKNRKPRSNWLSGIVLLRKPKRSISYTYEK